MPTVTVEDVTKRLRVLSPAQLSLVDNFLTALVEAAQTNSGKAVALHEESVGKIEDLKLDFWPEDEPVDDFLQARESWRIQDILLDNERVG